MCSVVMNDNMETQIEFVSVAEKTGTVSYAEEIDELTMESEIDDELIKRTIEISDDSDDMEDDVKSKPTEVVFVAPYNENEVYHRHSPSWIDHPKALPNQAIEIADSPSPVQEKLNHYPVSHPSSSTDDSDNVNVM